MVPLTNSDQYYYENINDKIEDLLEHFQPVLEQVRPSVYEVIFNFDWTSRAFAANNKITGRGIHYNRIRDSMWPEWDDQDEAKFITNLSDKIKKECYDNFQLDLYHNDKPLFKRVDYHPTPLEHLEYLEKVLPEITISQSTKEWTVSMDADVKMDKCKWHLKTPMRW